jgi:hypothetical protein
MVKTSWKVVVFLSEMAEGEERRDAKLLWRIGGESVCVCVQKRWNCLQECTRARN